MAFEWTAQQDRALMEVSRWMKEPRQQVFKLFGYAGTGKTTLARHFAEGIGGDVLFGAYTGKAADVMRSKGCEGAQTIHSMIYHTSQMSRKYLVELQTKRRHTYEAFAEDPAIAIPGDHPEVVALDKQIELEEEKLKNLKFKLNPEGPAKHAELIIIDEASFLGEKISLDLLSYGTKMLILGDDAQLPPPKGQSYFTSQDPDVQLTEITRQAKDSPIIHMATKVRKKEKLPIGKYGNCRVIAREDILPMDVMGADQMLVGTHKLRIPTNARIRELKRYPEQTPTKGDKIVCLRNDAEVGLYNGAIWYVDEHHNVDGDTCALSIRSADGDNFQDVIAHRHYFEERSQELNWYDKMDAQEFDFGYALTVHKAQGSQWDSVVVFNQAHKFRQNAHRWLYTGITRAAEELMVVEM
jgi:exodeoxyribonuclease-5